ncbi:MAG: hypothetical protein A3F11_06485 [Gammaproteobacteria bacterium RIFCSPHIGHO2_12_FULL_37_14]|nr:MAG: hypothetical protein A3F11_06485 [Gammaproteobacteria bacterium RIFCSPHIGHO2_12_FULL_37_14]
MLQTFPTQRWNELFPNSTQVQAINHLESGQILHFPKLAFDLFAEETSLLSPEYADPHSKNISYQPETNKLWGVQHLSDEQHLQLKLMMDRFSTQALDLIRELFPHYSTHLMLGRTSFRPIQISQRKTSYRKDDKRLHVDAFPSAPNQGKRILRVFCNINPHGEDRVWRVGESFETVAHQFIPLINKPLPGVSAFLRFLKITKSYRTAYDHYMLHMHNRMKGDEQYQKKASQCEIRFPAGSTWIAQTDQVSHAAMQGQYTLEQTFHLPVHAMQDESRSPLRILEKLLQQTLV